MVCQLNKYISQNYVYTLHTHAPHIILQQYVNTTLFFCKYIIQNITNILFSYNVSSRKKKKPQKQKCFFSFVTF